MATTKRKAFRCSRTGVLFPADYVEMWGVKYGRGLGPVPVSEALVNEYSRPVTAAESRENEAMHPVSCCRAQVDFCEVTEDEWNEKQAVLNHTDLLFNERSKIMRSKQMIKSDKMRAFLQLKSV